MLPHHQETIRRTTEFFSTDSAVQGLLLGGSLAHGFATEKSDVDVLIVLTDDDFRERLQTGRTCFFSLELCSYQDGYVDGKYTSETFIRDVARKGSEPARFAFQDSKILFSRSDTLQTTVTAAARYPREEKKDRIWRFQAQVEAWYWYCGEALKKQNLPLLRTAVSKLTLFGGRIVLAHNETLYPFHKWFLRVLEAVPEKPEGLLNAIHELAAQPTREAIDRFVGLVRDFRGWEIGHATWPAQFMEDSELNWLHQPAPVDDI